MCLKDSSGMLCGHEDETVQHNQKKEPPTSTAPWLCVEWMQPGIGVAISAQTFFVQALQTAISVSAFELKCCTKS